MAAPDLVTFGWQGMTMRVPAEWTLGAIGGDYKAGYLRLDDAHAGRVEIKWSERQVDLDRALERYLAKLGKRRQLDLQVDDRARVLSRRSKPDKRLRGFVWGAGDRQATGVIWRCSKCGRTVVAQVMSAAGDRGQALAHDVLASLEDHARDGRHTWALYGLRFEVPERFRLERQKLMAGYLELAFASGRCRLRVLRWGMAEVALAERDLQHWYEVEQVRRRDVVWECQPATVERHEDHDGLAVSGHRHRLLHRPRRAVERLARLRIACDFDGRAWHCPQSNRIYSVEAVHHQEPAMLLEVVASVACH
jgi:hypothetical protein